MPDTEQIDVFLTRWQKATGSERANYQLFLTELTVLLGLDTPDPSNRDTEENAYVFERKVVFHNPDGSSSHGFIDLYKRGCFVCEAKQTGKELDSSAWDNAMIRAHGQAQQYARALPAGEGRPPFIMVVDVGRNIELYSEFTRSGGSYVPFPDPRSHRIRLEDLRREEIRATLRTIWNDPLGLDPSRRSARVTREIASHLAKLAKSLEAAGHPADTVAAFLMRALFTMFAEDVGLLSQGSFTGLLQKYRDQSDNLPHVLRQVWVEMNNGSEFSIALEQRILRFNGGLFADPAALPLDKQQIDLLIEAAKADWRHVEPAIFGTLLERALDPHERHRLGAHYTPRAYVERLVMPAVIEPLRDDWATVQATALQLDREGRRNKAIEAVLQFHHDLCHVRVLDPACGSGNFLYVTLEHLKRLEGEVLNVLEELGHTQGKLELAGVTVDPHQMLGLETNPRAARIAEAVLWIGYLQWHFRTRGNVNPPEPVLKDFHNIECRDAVLAWDSIEYETDEQGRVLSRWDGRTTRTHPVTGEQVPDERAQVAIEKYIKPRKAGWPQADFIVGNPPFIGTKRMRQALGDGYVLALRETYPKVPESADYVMYWWHHAAELVLADNAQRFGLITTNSLTQTFNRKVIHHHLSQKQPLSLVFAIPDHPWVDSADGAAVRIAMTVGCKSDDDGSLFTLRREFQGDAEGIDVELNVRRGRIFPDLKIGADVASARSLLANSGISGMGVALHGSGFILEPDQAAEFRSYGEAVIKGYLGGKDLLQVPRERYLIDFFGMTLEEARAANPAAFQHVIDYVKPERDHNNRKALRELWWRFGWERPVLRRALSGQPMYIGTTETAKHRVFQFIPAEILADHMIVCFALSDFDVFGILSSRIHLNWALAAGGTLEDRPRYNKTRCFETFPFPDATEQQKARIRDLAEQLDYHRKRQQELHPGLTLTGMYNVLEKIRAWEVGSAAQPDYGEGERLPGDPDDGLSLTAKEREIHEHGLISVLKELHDELDQAVYEAYGWSDLWQWDQDAQTGLIYNPVTGMETVLDAMAAGLAEAYAEARGWYDEVLLERLVALNAERAAEEARGLVRWLRPEFQNPGGEQAEQGEIATPEAVAVSEDKTKKHPWPKTIPEQVQALRRVLSEQLAPASAGQLARQFSRAQARKVGELLETLADLGQVRVSDSGEYSGN